MIVYWLQRMQFTRRGKIVVQVYRGPVTDYPDSRSRAIKLGTGANGCRSRLIFKATCFNDSTMPPTLVRRDYGFEQLREYGAELPSLYTDHNGSIVRTADDVIVMQGPEPEASRSGTPDCADTISPTRNGGTFANVASRWMDTSRHGQQISSIRP